MGWAYFRELSFKNTPTSHAVSLALFVYACSDSALLFCHALVYEVIAANGVCLHFPLASLVLLA